MLFVKNSRYFYFLLVLVAAGILSCNEDPDPGPNNDIDENLTIFFINDAHGELTNFAQIKHLVDEEKRKNPTLLVSAGDMFSGSPYVDQYAEKGYPMIDIMNKVGVDIAVLGNHEFDYGLETLQARVAQSDFDWLCANVDASGTALRQPAPYKTLTVGDFKVTFLGMIETYGRAGLTVPATHPWRIRGLEFQEYSDVVGQYENLKAQEDADVLVALTHLGLSRDIELANNHTFFDLIIGGHSNHRSTETISGTPVLMAGFDLFWLGKAELTIRNKEVVDSRFSLIELWNERDRDENLLVEIQEYTQDQRFDEVVGNNETEMETIGELGCFYTTALRDYMQVDVALQNTGGIRAIIDQGDITRFEIYEMDPFGNGSLVFDRSVGQLKTFLQETRLAVAFTGIQIEVVNEEIVIRDENGQPLPDEHMMKLGINDFIAALYEDYFPIAEAETRPLTTAETIFGYLETVDSNLNFEGCNRIFRY